MNTQQPAPLDFIVPALTRPFTKEEQQALRSFIAILPVSPQLERSTLLVLRWFVAPCFDCRKPETVVTAEELKELVDQKAEHTQHRFSLAQVRQAISRIFQSANTLNIGQLQVERDAATDSLALRLNADNYDALLNFIVMLVGEKAV